MKVVADAAGCMKRHNQFQSGLPVHVEHVEPLRTVVENVEVGLLLGQLDPPKPYPLMPSN